MPNRLSTALRLPDLAGTLGARMQKEQPRALVGLDGF
jgi:hypothetical protein